MTSDRSLLMRLTQLRLLAAVLFATGCASPFQSGTSAQRATPPAPGPERTRPQASSTDPPNRAPSEPAGADRRVSELLATGVREQRARNFAAARAAYEQVLSLDPNNAHAHFKLALMADEEGRFVESDRHYTVLLKLYPTNATLLANRGWSYFLQGRYVDSERMLNEALRIDPNHRTALKNLGWLYGTRGDYDRALALFRRAGTEADAQRILAELMQASPALAAAGASRNNSPANRQSAAAAPPAQSVSSTAAAETSSAGLKAPAPWNQPRSEGEMPRAGQSAPQILGGTPPADRRGATWPADRFSAVDAYAETSPSQANQAVAAEPGRSAVAPLASGPDYVQSGVAAAGEVDRASAVASRGPYPVITPGTPGMGALDAARGGNRPEFRDPRWPVIQNTTAPIAGLPEGLSARATSEVQMAGGAEEPGRARGAPAPEGSSSWSRALRVAAQVGLAAGPAGPVFPTLQSSSLGNSDGAATSRPFNNAAYQRDDFSEPVYSGPDYSGPVAAPPAARLGPSGEFVPAQSASFAGASAGRTSLLPPIPTDVVPIAETPAAPRVGPSPR